MADHEPNAPAPLLRRTLSINDAAESLGIGRTKIYDLIADGKLKTLKIGRRTLVTAASIDDLVAEAA